MSLKLIADWKQAWKWFSMWSMGASTAFLSTWALLPAKFQDSIPQNVVIGIAVGLLAIGMAGRVVQQGPADAGK